MQIFASGGFWFLEGILFVVVVLAFRAWMHDRGVPLPAWKWAVFLLWLGFAAFTIAFVGTSFGEGEPTAATRGGLLFGTAAVIGGAAAWRLLMRGREPGGRHTAG
ncbi:MAG: hypothetical protein RRA92_05695 [Gemmatimonadota bacterium]|nr:hypothetical protein [Gemmatimonadota bacterium]